MYNPRTTADHPHPLIRVSKQFTEQIWPIVTLYTQAPTHRWLYGRSNNPGICLITGNAKVIPSAVCRMVMMMMMMMTMTMVYICLTMRTPLPCRSALVMLKDLEGTTFDWRRGGGNGFVFVFFKVFLHALLRWCFQLTTRRLRLFIHRRSHSFAATAVVFTAAANGSRSTRCGYLR